MHGIVDEKIDVYSFGVLILEIVTGRRALDDSQKSLVLWVRVLEVIDISANFHMHVFCLTVSVLMQAKPLLESSETEQLVDPSLGNSYNKEEMDRVLLTASLCIDQNPILRPRMSQASFRKLLIPLLVYYISSSAKVMLLLIEYVCIIALVTVET